MEYVLTKSRLFNATTSKPFDNKRPDASIHHGDQIVELHPDGNTTPVGTVKNPYFVEGQGWGYELEAPKGLHA